MICKHFYLPVGDLSALWAAFTKVSGFGGVWFWGRLRYPFSLVAWAVDVTSKPLSGPFEGAVETSPLFLEQGLPSCTYSSIPKDF